MTAPGYPIGGAYYAVPAPGRLILYRSADGTLVGETPVGKRTADELRRLADAIDGGRLL